MIINKKAAIVLADGFEEVEALTQVDILRRANIVCDMIGLNSKNVVGSHNISIVADKIFDDSICDYDMLIFPGGLPGATNLRDDNRVIDIVRKFNDQGKYLAAICAAPIVFGKAEIVKNKNVTSYPGYEKDLQNSNYIENQNVVVDGNIITSRGPATSFEFGYKIAEILGADVSNLREGMMYNFLMNK